MKFLKGQPKPLNAYSFPKGHKINLGRKQPLEEKQMRSRIAKEKGLGTFKKGVRVSPATEFKKGQLSYRGMLGKTAWNKGKPAPWATGKKSHLWKGGITTENQMQRVIFQNTIKKQVLERDNYTCQLCGERGGILHVDHIQSWADYVELRFDMNNCRTLCEDCHYFITWGKKKPDDVKTWGKNMSAKKEVIRT